jgi:hypothetical protein
MSDFVIVYGMEPQGVPEGTIFEVVQGRKRWVSAEEWWEVLKGVVMGGDGSVAPHEPWQPVAFVTNGWFALGLPDYDEVTGETFAAATAAAQAGPPRA